MDTDNTVREEDHQLRKAELSNQWRGGLQLGDNVDLGGQRMRVVGNNRDGTKPILSDAVDANAGERAYKQYKQHLSGAWKTKTKEPDEREWEVSGPLSDSESLKDEQDRATVERLRADGAPAQVIEAAGAPIRDAAYEAAKRGLQDAWKR